MTRPYANIGRPFASSAGSVPNVANCSTVPRRLYGFAGQPGSVTTGFALSFSSAPRTCGAPVAPVGFGAADGTPPHDAQEPIATMAAAFSAQRFSVSIAVLPATWQ